MQLSSWRWAQSCSKHIEDSNKHNVEVIVPQVGYLPEFEPYLRLYKKFLNDNLNNIFLFTFTSTRGLF
jgi:hypothetical protein